MYLITVVSYLTSHFCFENAKIALIADTLERLNSGPTAIMMREPGDK